MELTLKEYLDMTEFLSLPQEGDPSASIPEGQLLLVGGDFSGIQKYIYKIASKHASKSLKGRSFYLRLLSDAIVRYLLQQLRLTAEAIVYNSGGSFYFLAPNNAETRRTIDETALHIERSLYGTHGTDLYLALDYVELPQDALMRRNGKDLRQVWTQLFNRRRIQKNRKFSRLLAAEPERFFHPSMHGGTFVRDSITGEELNERYTESNDGLHLSAITRAQIEIGKALQTCDTMLITSLPVKEWCDLPHISPGNLPFTYYFVRSAERGHWQVGVEANNADVIKLPGMLRRVRTFEELCKGDKFERLGVLRMDVDNLGMLFQQGIPAECATLKRYTLLSHKFDYFFTDYLHTIQEEVAPDSSLIIYSGGDDVFIVGGWNHTIALAKRIREDFRVYTKGDDRFSISGGIAILQAKYPIIKGADESANEEHNAKEHEVKTSEGAVLSKNSISFLGTPLNWDTEFPAVERLKDEILGLLNRGCINKSFLGKVMNHTANAKIEHHKIKNYKTYWMLTYDLTRMRQSTKNPAAQHLIDNCIREVCGSGRLLGGTPIETNYHLLELWCMACRWAELEYRTR